MSNSCADFQTGMIIPMDGGGERFEFQWNPHKLSRAKANPWNKLHVAGREQPYMQFGCGGVQIYRIEFDLSRGSKGDGWVKSAGDSLFELMKPTAGGKVKRPPRVKLILGSGIKATCVVTSVRVEYGPLYNPQTLQPYQAKVDMTFEEYK